MSKTKKTLFLSLIALIIIIIAGSWIAGRVLTANISKDFVVKKLTDITGYHVVIDGPLHWHYTLHPSLTIEKITFSDAHQTVIALEDAKIAIDLLPLLGKHIALDVSFDHWQQNQLQFSNGSAHLDFKSELLTLSRFKAIFYQGDITGNGEVDLSTTTPTFKININTSQIEIAGLLNDIANTASVSGKMDMQATLNSEGNDATSFINHLAGNIKMLVKNGKLKTIHLGAFIPAIASVSGVQQADFFETLEINNDITNGIANTTIALKAKSYSADGKGKINLNNQTLDLVINAFYTQSQQTKNVAIPIYISGLIASPKTSVDLAKPLTQLFGSDGAKIADKLKQLFN